MSQLLSVRGGRRLEGEVTIQGAKNSVLPILAATLLCGTPCVLHNCPDIPSLPCFIHQQINSDEADNGNHQNEQPLIGQGKHPCYPQAFFQE